MAPSAERIEASLRYLADELTIVLSGLEEIDRAEMVTDAMVAPVREAARRARDELAALCVGDAGSGDRDIEFVDVCWLLTCMESRYCPTEGAGTRVVAWLRREVARRRRTV